MARLSSGHQNSGRGGHKAPRQALQLARKRELRLCHGHLGLRMSGLRSAGWPSALLGRLASLKAVKPSAPDSVCRLRKSCGDPGEGDAPRRASRVVAACVAPVLPSCFLLVHPETQRQRHSHEVRYPPFISQSSISLLHCHLQLDPRQRAPASWTLQMPGCLLRCLHGCINSVEHGPYQR